LKGTNGAIALANTNTINNKADVTICADSKSHMSKWIKSIRKFSNCPPAETDATTGIEGEEDGEEEED